MTEKKIISLKKKTESSSNSASTSSNSKQQQHRNALPNAKGQIDSKRNIESNTAPIQTTAKPVVKKSFTPTISDDILEDYYDEDELLADSPSPPPPATTVSHPIAGKFTNRRVILKQSTGSSSSLSSVGEKVSQHNLESDDVSSDTTVHSAASKSKGIFERLDRRGVNENSKRKIQRIVINNTE